MSVSKTTSKSAKKSAKKSAPRGNAARAPAPPVAPPTPQATAPSAPAFDVDQLAERVAVKLSQQRTAPSAETSPFGQKAEKATSQLTVRLTEREERVYELAQRTPGVWDGRPPTSTTEALRRLAWEGARRVGLLDAATAPAATTGG